jgi:hypothetical protein
MAEIIDLHPAATGINEPIFNAVCEMEGDLRAIDEFADALALVSETMDESPHANAINRLAWEIAHRARRDAGAICLGGPILTEPNNSRGRLNLSGH